MEGTSGMLLGHKKGELSPSPVCGCGPSCKGAGVGDTAGGQIPGVPTSALIT